MTGNLVALPLKAVQQMRQFWEVESVIFVNIFQVEWSHNGILIDDTHARFSNNRKSIAVEITGEGDDGRYTCSVKNLAGQAHKDFIVRLTGT